MEHARRAEALGYRRVWLYDSPALYPDVWVELARVADRFKTMQDQYRRVCKSYNEDPFKVEPFEFFAYFLTFMKNYRAAKLDIKERERLDKEVAFGKKAPRKGSLLPQQLTVNQDIPLPQHPVLKTNAKRRSKFG